MRAAEQKPNLLPSWQHQLRSVEEACSWVPTFVACYNDQHRHAGIQFVTPSQRHSVEAVAISNYLSPPP
jgi:hypothetical protein